MKTRDDIMRVVNEIEGDLSKTAPQWTSSDDLETLAFILEKVVEFYYYLDEENLSDNSKILNQCESTLAAVEPFIRVASLYWIVESDAENTLAQESFSATSLIEQYVAKYREFAAGGSFEFRYRLLLDLFGLQLVYAGMNYPGRPLNSTPT